LIVALIAIIASLAAIFAVNAWRSTRNQSAVPPSTPVASTPARTLTYWITVQKFKDGKAYQQPFDISGEINFEADYQIRLNVRSPQAGYLYILNEGPRNAAARPEYVVVFPSSTANNGSEFISANQLVQIPDQSWLRFDKEQGVEKLWLVFGENPLTELEGIKAFANRQTRGLITDAQQNKAIDTFLAAHPAEKVRNERGDTLTTLKSSEKVLVYPIKLEHH
jgi:uncharacterized protein DUF4384